MIADPLALSAAHHHGDRWAVAAVLRDGPANVHAIAERADLTLRRVLVVVGQFLGEGWAVEAPGGAYKLTEDVEWSRL